MGLTHKSTGSAVSGGELNIVRRSADDRIIALAGNPNVGKSTVFNALTGMRQHTGNWPGKTVSNAQGVCSTSRRDYIMVDIPGTYSLSANSVEEEIARDFIISGTPDAVIVVCDATCLLRNMILVLSVLDITKNVIVCVNLLDEAKRKRIHIDLPLLSSRLRVPVIGVTARKRRTLTPLLDALDSHDYDSSDGVKSGINNGIDDNNNGFSPAAANEDTAAAYVARAEEICRDAVIYEAEEYAASDRRLDKLLTGRFTAFPVMALLLALVFYITIAGANVPSKLLSDALFYVGDRLGDLFDSAGAPDWLRGVLVDGVYRVLAWVVSVMLPPMAIFFPLFTLLEDAGYLPRVAYNLDRPFKCCGACGKQTLTMCMGFGCNAAGVVGCRIIDSPRERLLAVLTNNFVPCNGRFPMMISVLTMFFCGVAASGSSVVPALLLTAFIIIGIITTFGVTAILSRTLLRGIPSSFTLELPPYRCPQIGSVIVRSVFDRTLFVLGRAVAVAAPAGLIIWLFANITVSGGDVSLLHLFSSVLDPLASLIGLDGVILFAFILGFPANEIVVPIIIMAYTAGSSIVETDSLAELYELFIDNGWTVKTALCFLFFTLFHWPCSTTLITIKKETGSAGWTVLSAVIPTVTGVIICMALNLILTLFGL